MNVKFLFISDILVKSTRDFNGEKNRNAKDADHCQRWTLKDLYGKQHKIKIWWTQAVNKYKKNNAIDNFSV